MKPSEGVTDKCNRAKTRNHHQKNRKSEGADYPQHAQQHVHLQFKRQGPQGRVEFRVTHVKCKGQVRLGTDPGEHCRVLNQVHNSVVTRPELDRGQWAEKEPHYSDKQQTGYPQRRVNSHDSRPDEVPQIFGAEALGNQESADDKERIYAYVSEANAIYRIENLGGGPIENAKTMRIDDGSCCRKTQQVEIVVPAGGKGRE